jgi:hypothetical protein
MSQLRLQNPQEYLPNYIHIQNAPPKTDEEKSHYYLNSQYILILYVSTKLTSTWASPFLLLYIIMIVKSLY